MPGSLPIILLHGAWHGAWCWEKVGVELAARGRSATAVDMAGHGLGARRPMAALARPFDPAAFATEPSPVAEVSLDAAGDLLVSQLRVIGGGRPCVLVAHSMGGTVATRAIQQAPDLVSHVIYLSAFMPASDVPVSSYITMPENEGDFVPHLVRADPQLVGAVRLDTGSDDPEYRALVREAFYNDLDAATADSAIALLSCDAPVLLAVEATSLTSQAWGAVPRTYVRCLRDNIIRPELQRRFIREADAAFPENPTATLELDSSHSPFLSTPERVAEIISAN
jgi:pimeloyl-ACP methyl ester carboxylesterase